MLLSASLPFFFLPGGTVPFVSFVVHPGTSPSVRACTVYPYLVASSIPLDTEVVRCVVFDEAIGAHETLVRRICPIGVVASLVVSPVVPSLVAPERPPPFLVAQSVGGGGVNVRSRSFVRLLSSPRQPKRLGGTSRNVVVFLAFPSATLNITYILHWVIRPWLSHVFIRFIGHRALTSKGDEPVPIRG